MLLLCVVVVCQLCCLQSIVVVVCVVWCGVVCCCLLRYDMFVSLSRGVLCAVSVLCLGVGVYVCVLYCCV